jgi:hypothetical protein
LKRATGPVADALRGLGADAAVMSAWRRIVDTEIDAGVEDDEF